MLDVKQLDSKALAEMKQRQAELALKDIYHGTVMAKWYRHREATAATKEIKGQMGLKASQFELSVKEQIEAYEYFSTVDPLSESNTTGAGTPA